ncbi:hypothetical protein AB4Z51_10305, partial [Bradyrhizobium sp. 2TAF36]|uniref:hypothetical protein n=1 Tax=Bradyrhizobium sp. 2TAF36 TaxID=3233016 RepID=UPI003F91B90A
MVIHFHQMVMEIWGKFTLALLWQNVFAPLFFKDLLSAIWALLRRRPKDEIDDGVTYGGHGWLGRRP